jgi:hypothetical protein
MDYAAVRWFKHCVHGPCDAGAGRFTAGFEQPRQPQGPQPTGPAFVQGKLRPKFCPPSIRGSLQGPAARSAGAPSRRPGAGVARVAAICGCCGPPGLTDDAFGAWQSSGVPSGRVHGGGAAHGRRASSITSPAKSATPRSSGRRSCRRARARRGEGRFFVLPLSLSLYGPRHDHQWSLDDSRSGPPAPSKMPMSLALGL